MTATEDQHPVEALATDGTDEALSEPVSSWRPDRGADGPDALRPEDLVETRGELGVSVPDQELDRMSPVAEYQAQVAGLLDDPRPIRVCRDPHHVHPSGVEFDEEEHVKLSKQHRVDGEEIAGQHGRRLAAKELFPAGTCPHR